MLVATMFVVWRLEGWNVPVTFKLPAMLTLPVKAAEVCESFRGELVPPPS
jgi:hypothetical protein